MPTLIRSSFWSRTGLFCFYFQDWVGYLLKHFFSALLVKYSIYIYTQCFAFLNVNAMYAVKDNTALAAYPKREIVGRLELNPVLWQTV